MVFTSSFWSATLLLLSPATHMQMLVPLTRLTDKQVISIVDLLCGQCTATNLLKDTAMTMQELLTCWSTWRSKVSVEDWKQNNTHSE